MVVFLHALVIKSSERGVKAIWCICTYTGTAIAAVFFLCCPAFPMTVSQFLCYGKSVHRQLGDIWGILMFVIVKAEEGISENQCGWGWKWPLEASGPTHLFKQGHLEQVAQDHFQGGRPCDLSGHLISLPINLKVWWAIPCWTDPCVVSASSAPQSVAVTFSTSYVSLSFLFSHQHQNNALKIIPVCFACCCCCRFVCVFCFVL